MADHVDITLWIDRRWKDAIEKHLKGETLQEHLENVLDELCNQLPEREYKRISAEIYAEDAAEREAREAARTYAAYHVVENGQEWYFKTSPGEELLDAAEKLRGYVTAEKGSAPDLFIKLFADGQPITAEEYNALTALRMENTGKVRGVFDANFDKREFSAVHIMDGWQTWAMRDVSVAAYHATRSQFASSDDQWRKLLDHLSGKEITSAGHLSARNFSFSDEIMMEEDGKLNFYVDADFDVDAAFGNKITHEFSKFVIFIFTYMVEFIDCHKGIVESFHAIFVVGTAKSSMSAEQNFGIGVINKTPKCVDFPRFAARTAKIESRRNFPIPRKSPFCEFVGVIRFCYGTFRDGDNRFLYLALVQLFQCNELTGARLS